MSSRNIEDLQPQIQERVRRFEQRCTEEGLEILIYCTLRTSEDQAKLYWQGRNLDQVTKKADELRNEYQRPDLADLLLQVGVQPGKKVTNAGPGQSMHNYGLAIDGVPMRNGKAVWGTNHPDDLAMWELYGRLGQEVGFEWAGTWTTFREFPHLQEPGAGWKELIRQPQ